uniref:Peptidase M3A/M3B catalytic domain-containing protein n=1 Tax=Mucochytrium quahogii TaxID=96639 RepID=A0A7S2W7S7_9STRA|mmetsp:Transcript_23429/g.37404  ORF Transcript_23429/g.37404 Transcript_23429/m.37404 type:complete len:636 (+) Transcript_23429:451-2358(+)
MGSQGATASPVAVIERVNEEYIKLHKAFEDEFWATKMNLKGNSSEKFSKSKVALDEYLMDKANLQLVTDCLESDVPKSEAERKVLEIMKKTFSCYTMESEEAAKIKKQLTEKEQELAQFRRNMKLGYTDPESGEFVEASSVQLRTKMRVSDDEKVRKACYEGLVSIGDRVAEPLVEIVKLRNKMAQLLGYKDFYDYNVTSVEGFSKATLFEILDKLVVKTKSKLACARDELKTEKGTESFNPLEPWNVAFALSGTIETELSPYFPFTSAVEMWGKTFSKLGIKYQGSNLNLDLVDRKGKYSNGFAHWPVPAHRSGSGEWVPSTGNFTSLASPNAVGSGRSCLKTLMHEAGHAAHFASVDPVEGCGTPLFCQERAPTSVAYAECQSMTLDSIIKDADWIAKYAKNGNGERVPWALLEKYFKSIYPYSVFDLRGMLMTPYFEKAIYECPAEELTAEHIKEMAASVEIEITGGRNPLPAMAVPHILSSESCCYYHGYVLAEMSVHQNRKHFIEKFGSFCDNPNVGPELLNGYWKAGNSVSFLDLVKNTTGRALSADAWLEQIVMDTDDRVAKQKAKYEQGIKESLEEEKGEETKIDLDLNFRVVHGDEVIADSKLDGGFHGTTQKFKTWIQKNYATES